MICKLCKPSFYSNKKIYKLDIGGTYLARLNIKYIRARERLRRKGAIMGESEIERRLVEGIRELGGRAFKWVSPGNGGVPDRIVVLPGCPAVFVELKTATGKLTSLQRLQLKRLRDMGQDVRVLYGERETESFLGECKEKLRDGV